MLLHTAIQALRPNNEFSMFNDDPATIIWNDKNVKTPTDSEIKAKYDELLAKELADEISKTTKKQDVLNRLGITEEEAKLLLL